MAVSHLPAGSQPAAATARLPLRPVSRHGSQPGGDPSRTIWIRAPVARLCPLLHNPSIRARRVYGRGAGGEQSTADAVDRAGHSSYYGEERGGRRRQSAAASPPAVASHHPRWRRTEGGAQPSTPPAAPDHSPKRRSQVANSQPGEAPAPGSRLRAATHSSGTAGGIRPPPPATPRHRCDAGRRRARRPRGEGPSAPRGPRCPVWHQGCRREGDAPLRTGRSAAGCQAAASSPQPPDA